MRVVVSHDRQGADRAPRYPRSPDFRRFEGETGDRAIVLEDLDFFARLESGNDGRKVLLGFSEGDLGHGCGERRDLNHSDFGGEWDFEGRSTGAIASWGSGGFSHFLLSRQTPQCPEGLSQML